MASNDQQRNTFFGLEAEQIVEEILKKVPQAVAEKVRPSIGDLFDDLKKEILDGREPRILLVGRRGSGKSSLINALIGEPKEEVGAVRATTIYNTWKDISTERGSLKLMDTRGFGESGIGDAQLLDALLENIGEDTPPDIVLFLVKAKEVDARVSDDAKMLKQLLERIAKTYYYRPVLIALVTQVDELDPVDVLPPFEDEEKRANIADAVSALNEYFVDEVGLTAEVVLPISAYMRFRNGEIAADRRWNIDELGTIITEQIPSDAKFRFVRVTRVKGAQRKVAQNFVKKFSTVTGRVSMIPIPIADMPLLVALQFLMVAIIAAIAGRRVERATFLELLSSMGINVAAGYGLREAFRQVTKLLPIGAPVASSTIAIAGTRAIGEAAIAYFIDNQSPEHIQAMMARVQQETEAAPSVEE